MTVPIVEAVQAVAVDLQRKRFFDDSGGRFRVALGQIVAKAGKAAFPAPVAAVPGEPGNAALANVLRNFI